MEIIKPSCELWVQDDPIAHVARCARICYKSNNQNNNVYYNLIFNAGNVYNKNELYEPNKYYIAKPVSYGAGNNVRTYHFDTKEYRAEKFTNEVYEHFDMEYLSTYFKIKLKYAEL